MNLQAGENGRNAWSVPGRFPGLRIALEDPMRADTLLRIERKRRNRHAELTA